MTAAHTVTVQRMVDLIEKAYANRLTLERISAAFSGPLPDISTEVYGVVLRDTLRELPVVLHVAEPAASQPRSDRCFENWSG